MTTEERYVDIREAARILGVAVDTLRNWDRNNGPLLPSSRDHNRRRYYRVSDLINYREGRGQRQEASQ